MPPFRGNTAAAEFALHVISPVLDSSTLSVGWTVTPDVLAEVTKHEADGKKSWMMLLIFSKDRGHEQRKIVPLRDCIAYLGLERPGKTRVYGQILCGSRKDVFKSWLTKERPTSWETKSHFHAMENGFPVSLGALKEHRVGPEISIDLEAPSEVFASEPPAWERKWVNRLFPRMPAYDQCEYRRRRLVAYTVQPVIAVGWTLFIAVVQAAAFTLFLVKPSRAPWSDMGLSNEDPLGDGIIPKVGMNWLLYPIFWWVPAGVTWLAVRHAHGHLDVRGLVALGAVFVPALVLFVALVVSQVAWLIGYTKSNALARVGRGFMAVAGFVSEPFVKLLIWCLSTKLSDEDILVLTTPRQERAPMELRDLPASKRTIKLRFFDLKAKVCRPFAR